MLALNYYIKSALFTMICVIYLNPTPINSHYRSSPHLLNPTHPYSTHQWLLQPHWWIHYHQLLTNPPSTHTQTYLHHKDTISDYQYGTILPPKDQQRVANTAHIAEAPPVVPSITAPITAPIPSSNAVVKPSTKWGWRRRSIECAQRNHQRCERIHWQQRPFLLCTVFLLYNLIAQLLTTKFSSLSSPPYAY